MRYFFCTFSLSSPHHLDANIVFVYQDNSSFIWATKSTLPSSSSPFVLFPIITWFGLLPYKNHPTTIPHLIQIDLLQEIRVTANRDKTIHRHLFWFWFLNIIIIPNICFALVLLTFWKLCISKANKISFQVFRGWRKWLNHM